MSLTGLDLSQMLIAEMSSIGHAIERLREEKGWTQAQLAERLGMHPTGITRRDGKPTQVQQIQRFGAVAQLAEH